MSCRPKSVQYLRNAQNVLTSDQMLQGHNWVAENVESRVEYLIHSYVPFLHLLKLLLVQM